MRKKQNRFLHHLPNLLTTTNLLMGVFATLLMVGADAPRKRVTACIFILIGGLADALDGKCARLFNAESDFGKQLDSFADIITFGVAPVSVIYSFTPLQESRVLLIALAIYVIAGVYRLARFNLGDFTHYFLGLPITIAGILTALYGMFISYTLHFYGDELAPFTAFILFVLAGFMVSTIEVPRPNFARFFSRFRSSKNQLT